MLIFNSLEIKSREIPNDIFYLRRRAELEKDLPRCSDFFLTLVKREVAGRLFFPPFDGVTAG